MGLFEKVGGDAAIEAAATVFYEKVMRDPLLRPFFATIDMGQQTKKLIGFMAWAFGGPDAYRGRDLGEAHARLVKEQGLTDRHFDAVMKHLKDTLVEIKIAKPQVEEALGIIEATRKVVLGRSRLKPK